MLATTLAAALVGVTRVAAATTIEAAVDGCSFVDADDGVEDVPHLNLLQHRQRALMSRRGPSQFRIYSMQDSDESDVTERGVLMNHLAKAGGSYVKRLLQELFKGNMSHLDVQPESAELPPINRTDADREFTVGLVRSPFDYYVSFWAFTSNISHCCFRKALNAKEQEHLAKTKPWGETAEDKARFQEFLRDISYEDFGVESLRFFGSYLRPKGVHRIERWQTRKSNDPIVLRQKDIISRTLAAFKTESGSIDCWIKTENLQADLRKCLRLYEKTKGAVPVDWNRFNKVASEAHRNHADHAPCSALYTDESLKLVAHMDRHILRAFGYAAHCAK